MQPDKNARVLETATAIQWVGSDGVLRHVIKDASTLGLDEAKENLKALKNVSEGRRLPMVAKVIGGLSVSRVAREYYGGEEAAAVVSCVAMVTDSTVARVVAHFFLALNRPLVPMSLFTSDAEALDWAATHLPKEALQP